ncbi:MAG TPA: HAMP domain-containing histidine kinase [Candidatus Fimimonas merdipullorum]|uniref:histidine kinase n=1 Tax=Candidatus Fimimonas merdipullorum TaxID=2840822 RepID=A0A9D1SQ01_9BACT|nr:HAMP domain-containing histidine kinase [Candidatus Fimimonas merdipullorum]
MIRRLRKRIVAINVITASLILFCALIVTFVVGYGRIDIEREARMNLALNFDTQQDEIRFEEEKIFDDVVLAVYDARTHQVEWFFGGNANLTREELSRYVRPIVRDVRREGWVNISVRYVKAVEGSKVKIAFNNLGASSGNLVVFAVSVLGALTLGIIVYFLFSLFLARIALRPVEDSWKKQKQFVADASHELKTPLSVILANTDILASHKDETVESQMKWVENTRAEAVRMAELVNQLLFLAKNDDGLKVQMQDVNFSNCVEGIVLGYDAVFYEKQHKFSYEVTPDVWVVGNEGQLKQLVTILLDNANKYSKGEGNITLRLQNNGKHCTLTVANDSEQLSEEQLSHLFDRFYTVDNSRNKNNGGNGLGLNIAQVICQTHNGSIRVSCENGRTAFDVTFPLKRKKD